MKNYLDLMAKIMEEGELRGDRTGIGTTSLFGEQLKFKDIENNFPILTTKNVWFKGVAVELLWFIRGCGIFDEQGTNLDYLHMHNVKIWDMNVEQNDGNVGLVYGSQWRCWDGIEDQLQNVIDRIKSNPECRRLIVSAWNVSDIPYMCLPPCHILFQFYVSRGERLHCQMYQRSADYFLGVPFNIASYALLMMMVARVTGLKAGDLTITFGDVHLYNNHKEAIEEHLNRTPLEHTAKIVLPVKDCIDAYEYEDIKLEDYEHLGKIKAELN